MDVKTKRILWVVFACTVVLVGLLTVRYKRVETPEIRIGAIYPLTGPAAGLGQEFKRGAEIASDDLRAQGVKIRFAFEDSKTDPKAGMAAYQKLHSEGIRFFLTTLSSVALAIEPKTREDGSLLFADVAYPGITGRNNLLFRHSSTAEQEASVIAEHLSRMEGKVSVGILWNNDDYGSAFKKALQTRIGSSTNSSLVVDTAYTKDTDLRAESLQVLEARPLMVVVAGFGKSMGLAIRRLRESGYQGKIIASMGFTVTPDAATAAGDAAIGIEHTFIRIDENESGFRRFAGEYHTRYGGNPPTYAVLAYNSATLLGMAIKKAGSKPDTVSAYILAQPSFSGAGGTVAIMPTGDMLPPVGLRVYSQTTKVQ